MNMLLFHTSSGPCSAPWLRRKIDRAIDKRELLAQVNQGVGTIAHGPLPGLRAESARRPQATRRHAREMRTVRIVAGRDYYQLALTTLRRQLREASVDVEFELVPYARLLERLRNGAFEAALVGAGGSTDPDIVMTECFHSRGRSNFGRLVDEELDTQIDAARSTWDAGERGELYDRACARIAEVVPAVFLRHGASIVAHCPGVAHAEAYADNLLRLERMSPDLKGAHHGVPA